MRNVWRMKMEQFTSFTEDERRTLDEIARPAIPGRPSDIQPDGPEPKPN